MKWLYENWYKSTLFLAVYCLIFAVTYLWNEDYGLFLIWLQTVVYFTHQFEEYIYPGGFVYFFNKNVLDSSESDFPLDKKASFWINIPIIFIGFPVSALLAGIYGYAIGIWTAYFSIINALSHLGMYFKNGYNPGLVVSVCLNIPIGIYTIYYFSSQGLISTQTNVISLIIGILIQLTLMVYGFIFLKPKALSNRSFKN